MDVTASRRTPTTFARDLFAGLPERYDRLAGLLSFGQDPRWRRELVRHVRAPAGGTVLDVACGPCAVTLAMAAQLDARFVGIDVSEHMLRRGESNLQARGVASRVALVLGRGEELPFPDASFDALSFTYLLRYVADPAATLRELARVVSPGGTIASLEFAVPPAVGWRSLWRVYTHAVLPVAGFALGGPSWFDVGRFLGPSIEAHDRQYPLDWLLDAWRAAGIEGVGARRMSLGGGLVVWGTRSA